VKTYELTYIISPEITSEEAESKAKEIEAEIQKREGAILAKINPSAKTLAYPIKKTASGFFGVLEFQLEPENLNELKEAILKNKEIIRQMITIKNPIKATKERRTKSAPTFQTEPKTEPSAKEDKSSFSRVSEDREKIELKDIEQKLDEILGE